MKERSEKSLHILRGYAIIAVLFWKRTLVRFRKSAGMAQSVEQLIRNQQVGGSSPPTSSIKKNACNRGVLFLCPFARRQVYPTHFPCFRTPEEPRPDAEPRFVRLDSSFSPQAPLSRPHARNRRQP